MRYQGSADLIAGNNLSLFYRNRFSDKWNLLSAIIQHFYDCIIQLIYHRESRLLSGRRVWIGNLPACWYNLCATRLETMFLYSISLECPQKCHVFHVFLTIIWRNGRGHEYIAGSRIQRELLIVTFLLNVLSVLQKPHVVRSIVAAWDFFGFPAFVTW